MSCSHNEKSIVNFPITCWHIMRACDGHRHCKFAIGSSGIAMFAMTKAVIFIDSINRWAYFTVERVIGYKSFSLSLSLSLQSIYFFCIRSIENAKKEKTRTKKRMKREKKLDSLINGSINVNIIARNSPSIVGRTELIEAIIARS